MAHLPRISDGKSGESYLKHRVAQVASILSRAEKLLEMSAEYERQGANGHSKVLQKRARDKAKIAMKLMGVLVWHHGVDMTPYINKAKLISHFKNGTMTIQSEPKSNTTTATTNGRIS